MVKGSRPDLKVDGSEKVRKVLAADASSSHLRIDISVQHIDDRVSSLHPRKSSEDDCRDIRMLNPVFHRHELQEKEAEASGKKRGYGG